MNGVINTENPNVLISLHKGYGLGDAVQMSAVLRHVVAACPHWIIDYQAEEGKHQVGCGIVAHTYPYPYTGQDTAHKYIQPYYDFEIQICLYDTWANWHDRPNTRVSSCLHDKFDLPWLPEYGRYKVEVQPESMDGARVLLWGGTEENRQPTQEFTRYRRQTTRYVAIHYQGDSSQTKKNLTHEQTFSICKEIERLGYEPLILDWREQCPIKEYRRLRIPREWGRDAEMVCAVISQCHAFVGIDSGPSKCASATDTPALVVWTGHHPAPFHDPAPNTTHLVPVGYHGLEPVCNDPGVIKWFEAHHTIRTYDHNLVSPIKEWLREVLE